MIIPHILCRQWWFNSYNFEQSTKFLTLKNLPQTLYFRRQKLTLVSFAIIQLLVNTTEVPSTASSTFQQHLQTIKQGLIYMCVILTHCTHIYDNFQLIAIFDLTKDIQIQIKQQYVPKTFSLLVFPPSHLKSYLLNYSQIIKEYVINDWIKFPKDIATTPFPVDV